MMQAIRTLIIDDERYARDELIFLLQSFSNIEIVGEADHGEAAILQAIQTQPDVVFLDVEMPNMNGIDVAKALLKLKKVPLIIFATAYPQFAAEAFRINAIDYLLKPYDMEQLNQAVERVQHLILPRSKEVSTPHLRKIAIEKDGEFDFVAIEDILYIHPEGKISKIITHEHVYEIKSSLKELENRLAGFNFFRVHRGYLVNLIVVVRLTPWFNGAYELELDGVNEKIPVSRNYVKELQKKLVL